MQSLDRVYQPDECRYAVRKGKYPFCGFHKTKYPPYRLHKVNIHKQYSNDFPIWKRAKLIAEPAFLQTFSQSTNPILSSIRRIEDTSHSSDLLQTFQQVCLHFSLQLEPDAKFSETIQLVASFAKLFSKLLFLKLFPIYWIGKRFASKLLNFH